MTAEYKDCVIYGTGHENVEQYTFKEENECKLFITVKSVLKFFIL